MDAPLSRLLSLRGSKFEAWRLAMRGQAIPNKMSQVQSTSLETATHFAPYPWVPDRAARHYASNHTKSHYPHRPHRPRPRVRHPPAPQGAIQKLGLHLGASRSVWLVLIDFRLWVYDTCVVATLVAAVYKDDAGLRWGADGLMVAGKYEYKSS